MKYRTLIHQAERPPEGLQQALLQLSPGDFLPAEGHYRFVHHQRLGQQAVARLRAQYRVDINTLPVSFDPMSVKLLVTDMDSTFIAIECIDEIADVLGIKGEVAAITSAAMQGQLDFAMALRQRVALLKGSPETVLATVYQHRLKLTEGAETLLNYLQRRKLRTALVSGGFSYFTERLQQRYQLDFSLANHLVVEAGMLTGDLSGQLIDAAAKAAFLEQSCQQLQLRSSQAIAIGDGANDLAMFEKAGLSVAFRAKPVVQQAADVVLNYSNLGAVRDFLCV